VNRNALLWAIAVSLALTSCSGGSFIDKVIIINPTDYPASVDVHGAGQASMVLATVDPHSQTTIHDVYDQGERWIFRFTYSGHDQELGVLRNVLAGDGWRVTIPDSYETQLRAQGVQPPP
jgi:hypothetical protein